MPPARRSTREFLPSGVGGLAAGSWEQLLSAANAAGLPARSTDPSAADLAEKDAEAASASGAKEDAAAAQALCQQQHSVRRSGLPTLALGPSFRKFFRK